MSVDNKILNLVGALDLPSTALDRWFSKNELRYFQEEGVNSEVGDFAVDLIKQYLERRNLPFTLIVKGVNPNSSANIQRALIGKKVDAVYLSSEILRKEVWRYAKGNQHGDILTIASPFLTGQEYYSSFQDGTLLLNQTALLRAKKGDSLDSGRITAELDNLMGYTLIGEGDRQAVLSKLWEEIFKRL